MVHVPETEVDEIASSEQPADVYPVGTLYIMRETDYLTGASYDYYKIGIVRGDKDVNSREKEHRTGNPRRISSVLDIESPAVQRLETRLHNEYARHRVSSGEWFYFPGTTIESVMQCALDLNDQLAKHIDALNFEKTVEGPGEGPVLPIEVVKPLADALSQVKGQVEIAKANSKEIAERLKALASGRDEWAHLFEIRSNIGRTEFSTALLTKNYKAIYERYKTISRTSVKPKWLLSASVIDVDECLELLGLPLSAAIPDHPIELHQAHLQHWEVLSSLAWDEETLESQILFAARAAKGVDGVLDWSIRESMTFDKSTFLADHPELIEECTVVKPAATVWRPAEWASYQASS